MNNMPSIGLKYCGGCNPQINRSKIAMDLKESLENKDLKCTISTDSQKAYDVHLLINGCMHACLEEEYKRSHYGGRIISVKGEMVDDLPMPEEVIPKFLLEKIIDLF
jgi:hypothetical protein